MPMLLTKSFTGAREIREAGENPRSPTSRAPCFAVSRVRCISTRAGAGDGGAVLVAEAELAARPLPAVVDADARALREAGRSAGARRDEQLRLRVAQVVAVVPQPHVERLAQVSRPRRAVQKRQQAGRRGQ